jgi:hypothetical protein
MTKQEALDHYGGLRALAAALDLWPQTVSAWREYPPRPWQYTIYVKSNHALLPEDMKNGTTQKGQ